MSKKILVVDDEPHIVMLVQSRLMAEGYDVVTSSDGQDALEKVRQSKPDLIILDLSLPVMDGFQVCSALRADSVTAAIPIVMLTAHRDAQDITKATELGAVSYVQKPFKAEILLGIIQGFIND
ncbi:MAG: response regulator [Candidatus Omnitrophica bacterium]|nr:response regulator [Candidatus Omnitrophota bacterium]